MTEDLSTEEKKQKFIEELCHINLCKEYKKREPILFPEVYKDAESVIIDSILESQAGFLSSMVADMFATPHEAFCFNHITPDKPQTESHEEDEL